MKVIRLVLWVGFYISGYCDDSIKRMYGYNNGLQLYEYEVPPPHGGMSEEALRGNPWKNEFPNYRGQYYGSEFPVLYAHSFFHPLSRPHIKLFPPPSTYVTSIGPRNPVKTLSYPLNKPFTAPLTLQAHQMYSLSPIKQYVPHHFPVYSSAAPILPKAVKIHSGPYTSVSPVPHMPLSLIQYHPRPKGYKEKVQNENVEYVNDHSESKNENSEEDTSDSDEDNIDRKDVGPMEVINLKGSVDDGGKDHKYSGHYSKKNGESYGDEHKSKKGYKTSEGHSSEHKYNKGEKGHHNKEVHHKDYDKEGKNKKQYHDEKSKHASHNEEDYGKKKGEFSEKKKHRKGSKTKGYHNVFHKDEYVKDHTFYDDADQSGHYKKSGEEYKGHNKESAKHKKGEHHDSGKKKSKEGHSKTYSKGHHDDADSGYNKSNGHDEHFKKEINYKKHDANDKNHNSDYHKGS